MNDALGIGERDNLAPLVGTAVRAAISAGSWAAKKATTKLAQNTAKKEVKESGKKESKEAIKQGKTAQEMAKEIKEKHNNNKNSVTIKTKDGHIRYDLDGKAHNNIQTPHHQQYIKHTNPKNPSQESIVKATKNPVSSSKQDLRTVKKYLKEKQ